MSLAREMSLKAVRKHALSRILLRCPASINRHFEPGIKGRYAIRNVQFPHNNVGPEKELKQYGGAGGTGNIYTRKVHTCGYNLIITAGKI